MNDDANMNQPVSQASGDDVQALEQQLQQLRQQTQQQQQQVQQIQQAKTQDLVRQGSQAGGSVFGSGSSTTTDVTTDVSQMGTVGNVDKEREPVLQVGDNVPLVQYKEEEKIPENVESWIERINTADDVTLPKAVTDDEDNVLVAEPPVTVINDAIILPLTEEEMKKGLKHKIEDSFRWLAEWMKKIIRGNDGKAFYREEIDE